MIGAGKGSAQMAAAFEKAWEGPIEGLVATRYGYTAPCERIEVIEARASRSRPGRARRGAAAAGEGGRIDRGRPGRGADVRRWIGPCCRRPPPG